MDKYKTIAKLEAMAKEAQDAICERANGQSNSFSEEQFQKIGKYLLHGYLDTPWPRTIQEELMSYVKNTSDIKTTHDEIQDFESGKVRYYLNGKSYGDLKADVIKTVIDRAKDPYAKAFTPQQANVVKEWKNHPFNKFNFNDNINTVINRIKWANDAEDIPKSWLQDAISEFKDLTNGIEREYKVNPLESAKSKSDIEYIRENYPGLIDTLKERAANPTAKAFTPEQLEIVKDARDRHIESSKAQKGFFQDVWDVMNTEGILKDVPAKWVDDVIEEIDDICECKYRSNNEQLKR